MCIYIYYTHTLFLYIEHIHYIYANNMYMYVCIYKTIYVSCCHISLPEIFDIGITALFLDDQALHL